MKSSPRRSVRCRNQRTAARRMATCIEPQVHVPVAMVLGSQVGLQHAAHISARYVGRWPRTRNSDLVDTGQHVHRGDASCDGSRNVGLKAVAAIRFVAPTSWLARRPDTRPGLPPAVGRLQVA